MAQNFLDEETVKKVIRQVEFYSVIVISQKMAFSGKLRKRRWVYPLWKRVGRVCELAKPEEVIEQIDVRTIAASPLEYRVKLEDVGAFSWSAWQGNVNSVRLPRHVADKRMFCGTALVEFSSEEDAANIVKQNLVYEDIDDLWLFRKDFDVERANEEKEVEHNHPRNGPNSKNNLKPELEESLVEALQNRMVIINRLLKASAPETESNNDTTKDNVEVTDEKVPEDIKDEDNNENVEKGDEKNAEDGSGETDVQNPEVGERSMDSPTEDDEQAPAKEKLSVAACRDNKDIVMREDLKSVFQKFESGYIRLENEGAAQKARAAGVLAEEGGLAVKNFIASLDPVTGDAEREYWSMFRNNQQDRRRDFKGNRGRGGKYNRGGKQSRGRGKHLVQVYPPGLGCLAGIHYHRISTSDTYRDKSKPVSSLTFLNSKYCRPSPAEAQANCHAFGRVLPEAREAWSVRALIFGVGLLLRCFRQLSARTCYPALMGTITGNIEVPFLALSPNAHTPDMDQPLSRRLTQPRTAFNGKQPNPWNIPAPVWRRATRGAKPSHRALGKITRYP
ncbi:hypothetical protein HAX54_025811 [Datura stramonium]|uniref:Uncharacterized protein n=1 Tax=Datura stramonium TaxID=4076 RepID=A0ABS8V1C3_DATST|nr:hypothetical protein [Datura stramonium]